ncbi:methyl-accepting chemotaxis protein [Salinicola sp. JS01]|uniref:methyl-accepting chemotaxis protein n=1 Tax=Salinicola sp. JS01 TaxID=3050071 RepID=UPI00255B6658|nr:methyl-accepting chemotaxis protein [Salinicola sp. JS01]WIX32560.1 methyl-accepting chemotaxis protein [Salinicola sp. JS01]
MSFLKRSVKLRLGMSLGLCIAMLIVTGLVGLYGASQERDHVEATYTNNLLPITTLGQVRTGILLNRGLISEALTSGQDADLAAISQQINENRQSIKENWTRYDQTSVKDGAEAAAAKAFPQNRATLESQLDGVLRDLNAGNLASATAAMNGPVKQSYTATLENLQQAIEANIAQAEAGFASAEQNFSALRLLIIGSIVLATLLASLLTVWLIRGVMVPLGKARELATALSEGRLDTHIDVTCQDEFGDMLRDLTTMQERLTQVVTAVRHNAESVQQAADEIAQGTDDLNRRTQEQAASLEQTAASMDEITATVRHNADNSSQADSLVDEVSLRAQQGGVVAKQAMQAMSEINESSQRISSIVGLIDNIAFQTNLLALNASVEAARAGEQGRGFAVVAGEVRTLAGRSADAAKEIKDLVKESVEKVGSGTRLVDDAGNALNEIVEGVKRVNDLMGEIAVASREQSQGIDQVNQAVSQMDTATQQNAGLVDQSSTSSRQLLAHAQSLSEEMAFFKVAEDRAGSAKRRPQPSMPAPQARLASAKPGKPKAAAQPQEEEWTTF